MLTERIQNLIKPGAPLLSAGEYRGAIEALRADLRDAEAEIGELQESREGVLLYSDEEAIAELEANLTANRHTAERIRAAIPRLEDLLAQASRTEDADELAGHIAEAEDLESKARDLVAQYSKAAQKIASLLGQLEDVNGQIEAIHQKAVRAGRSAECPDQVAAQLCAQALPAKAKFSDGDGNNGGVRLPHPGGVGMFYGADIGPQETAEEKAERLREKMERVREPAAAPGPTHLQYDDDGILISVDGKAPATKVSDPRYARRRDAVPDTPPVLDTYVIGAA